MTIINEQHGFTTQLIGGSYCILDDTGQVWYRESTFRKIKNKLKKIFSCQNLTFIDFKETQEEVEPTIKQEEETQEVKKDMNTIYKINNTLLMKSDRSTYSYFVVNERGEKKMKQYPMGVFPEKRLIRRNQHKLEIHSVLN
ncbi:MAG: hypothetical protein ACPGXZ_00805 [Saprospiraceae bacterium]